MIETGLSDFYEMTLAIMKACYTKQTTNIVEYSDFRKFLNDLFRRDFRESL